MKKNIYLLFILFTGFQSLAQNLVVNPSFENTSSNCANTGGEGFFTDLVGTWDNASNNPQGDSCSSPDLFSACNVLFGNPTVTNMPHSMLGYQYSHTGTHHAGIITHESLDEYREYIQGHTSSPLVAGQSYCVSMYVSLANSVMYASDNLGIYFGNTPYMRNPCPGQSNSAIYVTPQLNYDCGAITDTANWVRLQWNYVATGGEQYFMIGNFFNNANTTIVNNPGGTFINPYAYYYIDDVSIEATSSCCHADISPVEVLCAADAPITLEAVGGVGSSCSSATTGTWSGTGITDANAGTFDPSLAGAGTHTVTYTLSCGYSATVDVDVNACATLSVCAEANGDFTVSGGTGPYTWSEQDSVQDCSACQDIFPIPPCSFPPGCSVMVLGWTDFATGTTVTPSGNWPIRVVDSEGGVIEIASANDVQLCSQATCQLELSLVTMQGDCAGVSGGSITVAATGNIGTVSYEWDTNPVQTGATVSGLTPGSYTVTATDQQNCQATLTQVIENGSAAADAGPDQDVCKGNQVTLSATGGTSYVWDNGLGSTATGQTITFTAGSTTTYTVTVTDASGCTGTDDVTVTVHESPVAVLTSPVTQLCDDDSPIQLTGNPSGGTFSGPGMNGDMFDPAAAGVGAQTITYTYYDVPECPGTDEVTITVESCTTSTGIVDAKALEGLLVHPNPTSGTIVLENVGPLSGKATVSVADLLGRTVVEPMQVNLKGMRLPIELSSVASGQYLIQLLQGKDRIATIRITKK